MMDYAVMLTFYALIEVDVTTVRASRHLKGFEFHQLIKLLPSALRRPNCGMILHRLRYKFRRMIGKVIDKSVA